MATKTYFAAPVLCGAGYAVFRFAFLPIRARGTPGFRKARSLMRELGKAHERSHHGPPMRRHTQTSLRSLRKLDCDARRFTDLLQRHRWTCSTGLRAPCPAGRGLNLCLEHDASAAFKAAASRPASRDAHETPLQRDGMAETIILVKRKCQSRNDPSPEYSEGLLARSALPASSPGSNQGRGRTRPSSTRKISPNAASPRPYRR